MTPDRTAEQQAWAELGREEQDRRLTRLSRRIKANCHKLTRNTERDLEIYTTYILTARSLQTIGRDVGISGERTRQVVARILRGLNHPKVKSLVGDPT